METPVLVLTPEALSQSLMVVVRFNRLSVKSAPSMFAPSKRALIIFALLKSITMVSYFCCTLQVYLANNAD